jgi:hypothetical protein
MESVVEELRQQYHFMLETYQTCTPDRRENDRDVGAE